MLSAASAAPPPSAMRPAQLTFVRRRSDGRRPFGSEHRTRSSSAWCRPSCRARSDSRWAARRRHGSRRRRRRRHRCRRGNCFQLHARPGQGSAHLCRGGGRQEPARCAVALTTSCSPRHRCRWRQRRRRSPPPPRRCTCALFVASVVRILFWWLWYIHCYVSSDAHHPSLGERPSPDRCHLSPVTVTR